MLKDISIMEPETEMQHLQANKAQELPPKYKMVGRGKQASPSVLREFPSDTWISDFDFPEPYGKKSLFICVSRYTDL